MRGSPFAEFVLPRIFADERGSDLRQIRVHPRLMSLGHIGQQLTFNSCNLSVNHSEDNQLTAASEGKVFAVCANASGSFELCSIPISTNIAAADLSPTPQIISASA